MYKLVDVKGSYSLVVGVIFDTDTMEEDTVVITDYDDDRHSNPQWDVAIDEQARKVWRHVHMLPVPGDRVMIVKGRKIPAGEVLTYAGEKTVADKYGRPVAEYWVFDDGRATNSDNCMLII